MNILLTGGTGYIGSHTAVVLAQAGHKVVLFDNLCNSNIGVVDRLQTLCGVEIPFIKGDVHDSTQLVSALQTLQINAVIHFAGLKAVGESVEKPLSYYANNVGGTLSLLQAMTYAGVRTLVFSSSATVYGEPHYLPIDEHHPTSITNPYGRTKLHIEEILADVAKADTSWRIICLRYFNPVGAHPSGLIGEDPRGIPSNLMPYIARVAVGKLPYLCVFGNDYPTPDGTGVRDYIHVMDLAEGHLAALERLVESCTAPILTFNLGTGKGYSVLEVVHAFEKASGKKIAYKILPRRTGDVAICYAKVEKAETVLDWKAKRSLQEMCASTLAFQNGIARM